MAAFEHSTTRRGSEIHTSMRGVMTEEDALLAIAAFESEIPTEGSFEFHVHLRDLERYEPPAREAWTRALRRYKKRCRRIVIYGARPLIRMAAATVAMVIGLSMEFATEPNEP